MRNKSETGYSFNGAKQKQERVEWVLDPYTYSPKYGLLESNGEWAVVESTPGAETGEYIRITEWLDSRQAAVGFLKLLSEK
jgi:hypothetical protein